MRRRPANCDGTVDNGCEANLNDVDSCGTTCADKKTCQGDATGAPNCIAGTCGIDVGASTARGPSPGSVTITDAASMTTFAN